MNKSIFQRVFLISMIVYLSGCSTFHSPFDGSSYTDSNSVSDATPVDITDSTDDVPYVIGQYLDEIRIANSNNLE